MLRAAAQVFFEQGYAAASIDAVIEQVGGSKRTIYNEFGSKEGLFNALLSELADEAHRELSSAPLRGSSFRSMLTAYGRRMMKLQMSPTMLGAYRLAMAESRRFPDLARLFYDKLPGFAADRLAEILEAAKTSGQIDIEDCSTAARLFVGMGRDNIHLAVVLGLRPPPRPSDINALVDGIVSQFIDGVRIKAG